jgi:hypothetical protein
LALALAAAITRFAALGLSFSALPHDGDCDNMAGECLRHRQGYAITLIELACLVSGVVALAFFVRQWRGRRLSAGALVALLLCAGVASLVLAIQPVEHLNNRWTGWLGDNR